MHSKMKCWVPRDYYTSTDKMVTQKVGHHFTMTCLGSSKFWHELMPCGYVNGFIHIVDRSLQCDWHSSSILKLVEFPNGVSHGQNALDGNICGCFCQLLWWGCAYQGAKQSCSSLFSSLHTLLVA